MSIQMKVVDNMDNDRSAQDSGVKARLLQLLKVRGMTRQAFSQQLGVSVNYVGSIRKSLPPQRVSQIMELFPGLNRDWLLYGEGEMFTARADSRRGECERCSGYEVPLLPVQAEAGTLSAMSQGVMPGDCETTVSPVKADLAIRVHGDSMEPNFLNGDTLLIRKVNERCFIPWGNPMVIDTENGVLVKAVYPGEEEDTIEARSYNPAYPPLKLPASGIYGLYQIVGRMSIYATL